jgi:hypothetical protein
MFPIHITSILPSILHYALVSASVFFVAKNRQEATQDLTLRHVGLENNYFKKSSPNLRGLNSDIVALPSSSLSPSPLFTT